MSLPVIENGRSAMEEERGTGGRRMRRPLRFAVPVLLAAVVLILAYARSGSSVVVVQAVVTGVLLGGVYGLVAMGLTLIFGVLDIVNFAHGTLLAVGMYGTFLLSSHAGIDPYLTLPVTAPALFGLGMLLQSGLVNRTMGRPLETRLLLTLGIGLLVENILLLGFGGDPRSVRVGYATTVHVLGAVTDLTRLFAFAGAMALAGLLYLLLRRTRLGTTIRAVAANPRGARLVGIDVRRAYTLTFAIGAACAGAAGTLVAPFLTIQPTAGDMFTIIAFVVVVLGGMGNVGGALAGGLIVGLTEQFGGVLLPGQSPLLAVFVVFVAVLFARPQGLFGGRE